MMGLSMWQIALVVLVFILLFGRGKISTILTDVGEGIKGFKKGLQEETEDPDSNTATTHNEKLGVQEKQTASMVEDTPEKLVANKK